MKPKPIRRRKTSWAWDYLIALREELGDEAFEAEIKKTAIDLLARNLSKGKNMDERLRIGKRAFKARKKVDEDES